MLPYAAAALAHKVAGAHAQMQVSRLEGQVARLQEENRQLRREASQAVKPDAAAILQRRVKELQNLLDAQASVLVHRASAMLMDPLLDMRQHADEPARFTRVWRPDVSGLSSPPFSSRAVTTQTCPHVILPTITKFTIHDWLSIMHVSADHCPHEGNLLAESHARQCREAARGSAEAGGCGQSSCG